MEEFSLTITNRYMTGSIRDYLVYIFTFFIIHSWWRNVVV